MYGELEHAFPRTRSADARAYGHAAAVRDWAAEGRESMARDGRQLGGRSVLVLPPSSPPWAVAAAIMDDYADRPRAPGALPPFGALAPGTGGLLAMASDTTLRRKWREALFSVHEGRRMFFSLYGPASLSSTLPAIDAPAAPAPTPRRCTACRLGGHTRPSCTMAKSTNKCSNCRERGHETSACTNATSRDPRQAHYTEWARRVYGNSPCPLCASTEPMGAAHLITRCLHPSIVARRALITSQLPTFLGRLVTSLEHARVWAPGQTRSSVDPTDESLWGPAALDARDAASGVADWTTGHGAWVLFRVLTATPWSFASLDQSPVGHQDGLAKRLAVEFEYTRVPAHRLRRTVDEWLFWAGRRLHELCVLWKDEVDLADRLAALRAVGGGRLAAHVGAAAFVPQRAAERGTLVERAWRAANLGVVA
jgi:hypothetical protein